MPENPIQTSPSDEPKPEETEQDLKADATK
jgi:hypothetical protein